MQKLKANLCIIQNSFQFERLYPFDFPIFLLVAPDLFVKEGLKIIEIVRSRRLKFMFDFMTIENQTNDITHGY